MLDRSKIIQELAHHAEQLFLTDNEEYSKLLQEWRTIISDPTLCYKIRATPRSWSLPHWHGKLDEVIPCTPIQEYSVAAIDGSQIYPDRHQGFACYLINIGKVHLTYGTTPQASFSSTPSVLLINEQEKSDSLTQDVNNKREGYELEAGFIAGTEIKNDTTPSLVLFDGSLIFWHLQGLRDDDKKRWATTYLQSLTSFFDASIPYASYISLPKSKELVTILHCALNNFSSTEPDPSQQTRIVDTHLMYDILPTGSRSTVLQNNATITDLYPDAHRPHFFYLNTGHEIGRVEIPAWIAQDETLINLVASIVLDQARKGHGYPVCLAEAHEQAVVKGPDRDFFYHVLSKYGVEHQRPLYASRKSLKKRSMGI